MQKRFEEAKGDPKAQAKLLKSFLPAKDKNEIPLSMETGQGTAQGAKEVANALNNHFVTVGSRTAAALPAQPEQRTRRRTDRPMFSFRAVTEEEMSEQLSSLKRTKSADVYQVTPALLKDMEPFFTPILTTILNSMIEKGEYPQILKLALVIPVHKAGSENDSGNYRPISLMAIIGKVFEALLNAQLMQHCIKYALLSPRHYGYRPGSTTVLCLQAVINRVITQLRKGRKVCNIYMDLSKAYDTIPHSRLLDRISKQYNLSSIATKLLQAYLTNRKQITDTRQAQSDEDTITYGIPQGGVLSTTLFVLYTNDIDEEIEKKRTERRGEEEDEQGGVYAYADDATTTIDTNTIQGLTKEANQTVRDLVSYYASLSLVPNMSKTHIQLFNRNTQIQVEIEGTQLQCRDKVSLLGITMQQNLQHQSSAHRCRSKIIPLLLQMRYAKSYLTTNQLLTLYNTQVIPRITYAITIWGSDKEDPTYLQQLKKTMKAFARIIAKQGKRAHTEPIRKEYKLLTLRSLYIQQVCMEMYPYVRNQLKTLPPEHHHNYNPSQEVHEHRTRRAARQLLFVPQTVNRNRRAPIRALAPLHSKYAQIWNILPDSIRLKTEDTRGSFRQKLTNYLLQHQR